MEEKRIFTTEKEGIKTTYSGSIQKEFFTTEVTENTEEEKIFVPKLRGTPCTPWLILTYWTPPDGNDSWGVQNV
ncbi:MAG: hypothetical protein LBB89_06390 [Treponema sp.]|jgi:hypothetical protein|nr:hypothetical protein [Treponema sp.]